MLDPRDAAMKARRIDEEDPMRALSGRSRGLATLVATIPLGTLALIGPAAAAASATQVTSVSPASGPELTSVPVKIRGSGFSTVPGATTVSFGGAPALLVTCKSHRVCTAWTPEAGTSGPVTVTATVGASTSTNPVMFTFTELAFPLVNIVTSNGTTIFDKRKLIDETPTPFGGPTMSNGIALEIVNTTTSTQTVISNVIGELELTPGSVATVEMPAETRALFTLTGSPKAKLHVRAKAPH
jgi:hypothetical protein